MVLFSDESHLVVGGQNSRFFRRSEGKKVKPSHITQKVKHPLKKRFWGCFSFSEVGSLYSVQGMMKSDQSVEVIQRRVIPNMQKAFPYGGGIFQQNFWLPVIV